MRSAALIMIAVSSLALVSCAHKPKGAPPIPDEELSAPPPVAEPTDGTQRIDPKEVRPKEKTGFFTSLAKKLGNDNTTPNSGPCPAVRVLYDASRFVEIDGAEKFANVGYTGEINGVQSSCRYVGSDPIKVNMQLDMAIGKGPKAEGNSKDVKYWVSVVRTDIAPISKQEFTNRVTFANGQDRQRFLTAPINITIPRASSDISGSNFEIIVGFDLNDKQLEFNRDGKRFKVNAGEK